MLRLALFVTTLFATMGLSPMGSHEAPVHPPSLSLTGARVYLDGEPVLGPFSVHQRPFGYLYLYVPGRGLYTIGAHTFEGATLAGEFNGRRLAFAAGGSDLRIDSRTRILGPGEHEAWVRHEPNLTFNVQGVVYGYGDHPSIAARWLEIYGPGEQ